MVVIVLIGIMTALIIPEMKGTFQDALLRTSGRKLIEVFNLANSRAISLHQAQRVRLDRKTGHYNIEKLANGREQNSQSQDDVPGGQGIIDDRISVDLRKPKPEPSEDSSPQDIPERSSESETAGSLDAIAFYADGTAEAAEIRLRDKTGLSLALRINPVTARVQILEQDEK
jgi:Tfp pilus assembly protein FimT